MPRIIGFHLEDYKSNFHFEFHIAFAAKEREFGESFLVFVKEFIEEHKTHKIDVLNGEACCGEDGLTYEVSLKCTFFNIKAVMLFLTKAYDFVGKPVQLSEETQTENPDQIKLLDEGESHDSCGNVGPSISNDEQVESDKK